jgi:hypothetical protein
MLGEDAQVWEDEDCWGGSLDVTCDYVYIGLENVKLVAFQGVGSMAG